jgi:hypothetical protein
MNEPTAKTVKDFWTYMSQEYDSVVIPKATATEMKIVATFLDVLNIQDNDVFMNRFTTTLGGRIYIPFELGVANAYYGLWGQIRVCVHEHQHIEQGHREGWIVFGERYITSSSYRAGYEAEAYGCDLEMEYWYRGIDADLEIRGCSMAGGLKNYGCNIEDIEQAKLSLGIRAEMIRHGGVENRASQKAIVWLNQHAPELRAA